MIEKQETIIIKIDELLGKVTEMKNKGCRLVQIGCTKTGEGVYELNYTFDVNYNFYNFRIIVENSNTVPSIQNLFGGAFIYENEISELYDIEVTDMLVDFKGKLYKVSVENPFK